MSRPTPHSPRADNIRVDAVASNRDAMSPMLDPEVNEFIPTQEDSASGKRENKQLKPSLALLSQASKTANSLFPNGKPLRSAFPLFASDIWSASLDPFTRSAGLPPKPSWESLKSSSPPSHSSFTASPHSFSSNLGLAVSAGDQGEVRQGDSHRLDFKPSGSAVRYTQTEEYHTSANAGSLIVKTDPLPQQPFAATRGVVTSISGVDLDNHDISTKPTSATSTRSVANSPFCSSQHALDAERLTRSSSQREEVTEVPNGAQGDVWTERQHARCLRRALKDPNAEWEEAYKGALTVLAAVNPEHFRMPANSRVINIKTEYIDNLIASIRLGKYSVMAKVSERIMEVWNARVDPSEKLLFLFSVNGSKRFSGLAEVSGPWDPNSFIEGWAENSESHGCAGSFPVTWVFVKDVPYHHFTHIRQPQSEHPVGNMWNGMNFPASTGRAVVQHYVQTPGTTSILGHPKNHGEISHRHDGHSYSQRRGAPGNRGQRGGRGSFRGGNLNTSWRQQFQHQAHHEPSQESCDDNDATPTPTRRGRFGDTARAPPLYSLDAAGDDTLHPTKLGSVSFDASGKLITIPPSLASSGDSSADVSFTQPSPTIAIARKARRQNLPRLHIGPNNESMHGGQRDGPLSTVSSNHSMSSTGSRGSFCATTARRTALQHSASMGMLGALPGPMASDPPPLPPSASMNSLQARPDQFLEGGVAKSVNTGPNPNGHLRQVYDCAMPPRQDLSRSTQSRASRGTLEDPQPSCMNLDVTPRPNEVQHQLMAQFHILHAEKFKLQHQLSARDASDTDRRYVNAQITRNGTELQAVELQMSMASSAFDQNQLLERSENIQYADSNSSCSGSGPVLSPIYAGGGSSFSSASLVGSPYAFADGRYLYGPQHRAHGSKSSWDLRAQSVDDLVSSPKHDGYGQAATMALHQAPGGLPGWVGDGKAGRANFSFHAPSAARNQTDQRGSVRINT